MTKDEFNLWAEQLEKATYRGWTFHSVHPGYFAFHHPHSRWTVFCTPDHEGENTVAIQVNDEQSGENAEAVDVPFVKPNRTATRIRQIVRPWLDRYHPDFIWAQRIVVP